MGRVLAAVLAVGLLGTSGCCKVACPALLTASLVDGAGNPLTPESVTLLGERPGADGFNDPRTCGSQGSYGSTTCQDNRITFHFQLSEGERLRVKATTGESFEGSVSPTFTEASGPSGACVCAGTVATMELTLAR